MLVVVMVVVGAVLTGVSVSQHRHHDAAVAAEAAQKAQVDAAARAEARYYRTPDPAPVHRAGFGVQVNLMGAANPGPALRYSKKTGPYRQRSSLGRRGSSGLNYRSAVSEIGGPGALLVIPALRVRAPIVATGAVDGSMNIPADIHTVGWYDGIDRSGARTMSERTASWPGQPGVSLVAGHVDWAGEGPGALYYINQLVVGDPIEVVGSNRATTRWRVSKSPLTISKKALPSDLFVNTGPPKLVLVTCGGPFDAATGHYLDNVVVWATPAPPR
jgi:hypothetical protein